MRALKEQEPHTLTLRCMASLGLQTRQEFDNWCYYVCRIVDKIGHRRVLLCPSIFDKRFIIAQRDRLYLAVYLLRYWCKSDMLSFLEDCIPLKTVPFELNKCRVPTCSNDMGLITSFCIEHQEEFVGLKVNQKGLLVATKKFFGGDIICDVPGNLFTREAYDLRPDLQSCFSISFKNSVTVITNPNMHAFCLHISQSEKDEDINVFLAEVQVITQGVKLFYVAHKIILPGDVIIK